MINKPPHFKGLNIRIRISIPIRGRGFINQRSGLLSLERVPSNRAFNLRVAPNIFLDQVGAEGLEFNAV